MLKTKIYIQMSGDATLSRHVKYSTMNPMNPVNPLNPINPSGSIVYDGQAHHRRYPAQNGRRNDLWLV
jgi:hypothetical protein